MTDTVANIGLSHGGSLSKKLAVGKNSMVLMNRILAKKGKLGITLVLISLNSCSPYWIRLNTKGLFAKNSIISDQKY